MLRTAPNVVSTHMNYTTRREGRLLGIISCCSEDSVAAGTNSGMKFQSVLCSHYLRLAHFWFTYLAIYSLLLNFLTLPQSASLISLLPPPNSFFPTLAQHWSQQYRLCPELNNIYLTRGSAMYTLHQAQQYSPSTIGLWKPTPAPCPDFLDCLSTSQDIQILSHCLSLFFST